MHTIVLAVVLAPSPEVIILHGILMGVFHLVISCKKHFLNNKKVMYIAYTEEYDRCALAGYDAYTCHHWGVYAGNLAWPGAIPGIPMGIAMPNLPTLTLPPLIPLWCSEAKSKKK